MKTTHTIKSCDIDGTTGDIVEVRFGYRGRGYSIDVCPEHLETFRMFVHHAVSAITEKRPKETGS